MSKHRTGKLMKRVTLTVDPDDYSEIDALARRSNVSASWLIRRSMREFLERHAGNDCLEIPLAKEER
ncbi:CopG family transcriptional regulator [Marinimicrobium sp. ABcell2]|uniref:ribbon-helix-helix domain-containing protein n=1 Tax=Marinimicrobium sp. ABcell2 TaxID=3069751 RepID=UPI0027AFB4C2|nr:CopG family transcriptional regulator [Marinimicrobium sp. ABcell2]MDQ2077482.1 CopG family transcriptional regulator [Marinimicrobium sp. ABcell2]